MVVALRPAEGRRRRGLSGLQRPSARDGPDGAARPRRRGRAAPHRRHLPRCAVAVRPAGDRRADGPGRPPDHVAQGSPRRSGQGGARAARGVHPDPAGRAAARSGPDLPTRNRGSRVPPVRAGLAPTDLAVMTFADSARLLAEERTWKPELPSLPPTPGTTFSGFLSTR